MESRWVALDVGETLIDESRVWSVWARVLGIPRLTLMAALGAEVALGEDHVQAFDLVGVPDWRDHWEEVERVYGGFTADDCYPDALPAVQELCARGYRVAIVANQPARRTPELRAIGFDPDVMAMSDEMGVHKPDGTLTWISVNSQPLFRGDGTSLSGVAASFEDITDRWRLEEALKQTTTELVQCREQLRGAAEKAR